MWWRRSVTWANVTFEFIVQSINAINIQGIIHFFLLTTLWSCPPLSFLTSLHLMKQYHVYDCSPMFFGTVPQNQNHNLKISSLTWFGLDRLYPEYTLTFLLVCCLSKLNASILETLFCFMMPVHDVEITSNSYRSMHICSSVSHNSFLEAG